MRIIFVLTICLSFVLLSKAANFIVQAGAVGGDGSINLPFGRITDAITVAGNDDTIIVKAGSYGKVATDDGNLMFGKTVSGLTIRSEDGPGVTFFDSGVNSAFVVRNCANFVIEGFTFSGGASNLATINYQLNNTATIRNCIFTNLISINFPIVNNQPGNTLLIENSRFETNPGTCIETSNSTTNVVDCKFLSNTAATLINARNAAKLTVTSSVFINSVVAITNTGATTEGTGSSFFSTLTGTPFSCSSIVKFNFTDNNFCGFSTTFDVDCGFPNPRILPPDSCKVCGGNDVSSNLFCNTCFSTTAGPCANATQRFVSPDGTGSGLTEFDPSGNIQAAIDASSTDDTIVLLPGTYTGAGNANLNMKGKAITIKPFSTSPHCAVIDCGGSGTAFTLNSGEDFRTKVTGLTIRNCSRAFVIQNSASVTAENLIISNCNAGPVVALVNGSARFSDTIFRDNVRTAGLLDGLVAGAANVQTGFLFVNITNSEFFNNVNFNGAVKLGGFIFSTLDGTKFVNNTGTNSGGPIFDSGAVVTITNSVFSGNGQSSASSGKQLSCTSTSVTVGNDNLFCGANGVDVNCPAVSAPLLINVTDDCSVCNGINLDKDCLLACFGGKVNPLSGGNCGFCEVPIPPTTGTTATTATTGTTDAAGTTDGSGFGLTSTTDIGGTTDAPFLCNNDNCRFGNCVNNSCSCFSNCKGSQCEVCEESPLLVAPESIGITLLPLWIVLAVVLLALAVVGALVVKRLWISPAKLAPVTSTVAD